MKCARLRTLIQLYLTADTGFHDFRSAPGGFSLPGVMTVDQQPVRHGASMLTHHRFWRDASRLLRSDGFSPTLYVATAAVFQLQNVVFSLIGPRPLLLRLAVLQKWFYCSKVEGCRLRVGD